MYILEKKLNVDNSLIVQDLDVYENLICPVMVCRVLMNVIC